jgi:hypothetical protein
LAFYGSMIDGSGAQSLIAHSRTGKRGLFAGLLLRHGTGVVEAWADRDLSRTKINKMLREAQLSGLLCPVERAYVDRMVQHAIGTGLEQGSVPPEGLLEIAELIGGTEWRDRRLDIKHEIDRMFADLSPAARTTAAVGAAMRDATGWMATDELISSWFEDGPQVQEALSPLPRTNRTGLMNVTLSQILPPTRERWTERFLLMALWCEAVGDVGQHSRAIDYLLVAQALTTDMSMADIPAMQIIATHTVNAALLAPW